MATSFYTSTVEAQLELQPELMSEESLLWAGQPSRKVIFHRSDWFMIPFSLLWGGFAIFWEYGVSGHFDNAHPSHNNSVISFMTLWGIPFILAGQYFIWGRFLYVAWRKARTFYGVTNKRVLVLGTGASRKFSAGYLDSLTSVSLTTKRDGMGTIEFAPEPESLSMWNFYGSQRRGGFTMDINLSRLAFFDIGDAKSIYQMIQTQRERLRSDN